MWSLFNPQIKKNKISLKYVSIGRLKKWVFRKSYELFCSFVCAFKCVYSETTSEWEWTWINLVRIHSLSLVFFRTGLHLCPISSILYFNEERGGTGWNKRLVEWGVQSDFNKILVSPVSECTRSRTEFGVLLLCTLPYRGVCATHVHPRRYEHYRPTRYVTFYFCSGSTIVRVSFLDSYHWIKVSLNSWL